MSNNNNKRSSTTGITLENRRAGMSEQGVGARHAHDQAPGGGGGYLSICTKSDFLKNDFEKKLDPRIQELREMGLGKKWLMIAEAIGFDAFMAMWRILDSDDIEDTGISSDRIRVWVPAFNRYLKFQRNRYIIFCASQGDSSAAEIRKAINTQLGELLSEAHIKRIMERASIE